MSERTSSETVYEDTVQSQPEDPAEVARLELLALRQRLEQCRVQCITLSLIPTFNLKRHISKAVLKRIRDVLSDMGTLRRDLYSASPSLSGSQLDSLTTRMSTLEIDQQLVRKAIWETLEKIKARPMFVMSEFSDLCRMTLSELMGKVGWIRQQAAHNLRGEPYDEPARDYLAFKEAFDDLVDEGEKIEESAELSWTDKAEHFTVFLDFYQELGHEVETVRERRGDRQNQPAPAYEAQQQPQTAQQQISQATTPRLRDKLKLSLPFRNRPHSLAKAVSWEGDGLVRISERTRARYEI